MVMGVGAHDNSAGQWPLPQVPRAQQPSIGSARALASSVAMVMEAMQVAEVVKYVAGVGDVSVGGLLTVDLQDPDLLRVQELATLTALHVEG